LRYLLGSFPFDKDCCLQK